MKYKKFKVCNRYSQQTWFDCSYSPEEDLLPEMNQIYEQFQCFFLKIHLCIVMQGSLV